MKKRIHSDKGLVKPSYSPSRLTNFFRCPYSFYLSQHWQPEFGASTMKNMRLGRLFEGYVFGFKKDTEKALIGRMKKPTIDIIKRQASPVKQVFRAPMRNSYVWLQHEFDSFVVRGEADFIGSLRLDLLTELILETDRDVIDKIPTGKIITDLKYTADIGRVWDYKGSNKEDYLQASFYPWLYWKEYGKILPFVYMVVESNYERPIVRFIHVEVNEAVFEWLEDMLYHIDSTIYFEPHASKENCLSGFNQARCAFMDKCEHGRAIVGGYRHIDLETLTTQITVRLDKKKVEEIEDAILIK